MAEDYKLIDNEEKHRYEFQIDDNMRKNVTQCISPERKTVGTN